MKIVINNCYGGFSLSERAMDWLIAHGVPIVNDETQVKNTPYIWESASGRHYAPWFELNRCHPLLIQVVTELGEKMNGKAADLKVIEIPDGVVYTIEDYDGIESVHEAHRSWC